jgi:hypothetical protein
MMYAKLFTSIYQGTLRGNSHGLLVFTNLLAHCDKDGIVDIHPRAIAEEVGLTPDQVRDALLVLESPDDESRSPEEQGRRIVRLDEHRAWGWRVVNYLKYRAIRNEDDRREQNRLSQARWREKNKPASANVSQRKTQSAHTEADAEALNTVSASADAFTAFWAAWPKHPRKVARRQCEKKFNAALSDGVNSAAIMAAVERAKASEDWRKDGGAFIPAPMTWLNQARWEAPSVDPPQEAATKAVDETRALLAEWDRRNEESKRSVIPTDLLKLVKKA